MREFATLPQDDRADALVVAARGKGMHPAIVEKDFWGTRRKSLGRRGATPKKTLSLDGSTSALGYSCTTT